MPLNSKYSSGNPSSPKTKSPKLNYPLKEKSEKNPKSPEKTERKSISSTKKSPVEQKRILKSSDSPLTKGSSASKKGLPISTKSPERSQLALKVRNSNQHSQKKSTESPVAYEPESYVLEVSQPRKPQGSELLQEEEPAVFYHSSPKSPEPLPYEPVSYTSVKSPEPAPVIYEPVRHISPKRAEPVEVIPKYDISPKRLDSSKNEVDGKENYSYTYEIQGSDVFYSVVDNKSVNKEASPNFFLDPVDVDAEKSKSPSMDSLKNQEMVVYELVSQKGTTNGINSNMDETFGAYELVASSDVRQFFSNQ